MRIGYCSPFNPMKSGISDFSEELVLALSKHVELVIFSPKKPEKREVIQNFETHTLSRLEDTALRDSLDLIVYHVGNNIQHHSQIVDMLCKYPGVLELHDFGMHNFAASKYLLGMGEEAYLKEVFYCHGEYGKRVARCFLDGNSRAPWETHALDLCMNRRYIEAATAVIVHSELAKQMTLGMRPDVPVSNIMLHAEHLDDTDSWKNTCRDKLGIKGEHLLVAGSFGFATGAKRILPTLDALKLYRETKSPDFLYFIVGEPQKELNIREEITARGLGDNVKVTGFVNLDEFRTYMGACDFCINLRYPTQGESSASLHRMLGMGKPAIVTDVGTFSDYPDDVVLKVRYDEHEVDDIYRAVSLLAGNKKELQKRGRAALEYARTYCDLEKNAKRYSEFFQQVHDHTWQPDYEDTLITRLCELGLTDEGYTRRLYNTVFSAI